MGNWASGVVSVLVVSASLAGAARASDPPGNVLVLLADDMGVDMVGAYGVGTDLPPTPRLDQLAGEGVLFRSAWSNPYCSPTRATVQTGRYSFRTGIGIVLDSVSPSLRDEEITLAEMIAAGAPGVYSCAAFGKWHLTNDALEAGGSPYDPESGGLFAPNLQGYDHYSGSLYNLVCGLPLCSGAWWSGPYPFDYFWWPKVTDGVQTMSTGYATSETVDDVLAWLDTVPEPWVCYIAFHAPHAPFQAPPGHLSSSGLPPGEIASGDPRPHYKAMVEALDTEIGRLLDGIHPDALDRTTVFFIGDNGTPAGVVEPPLDPSHAKATVFEGGIHVPFIVKSPLVTTPGSESAALVNTTDVFATVADIAGVDLGQTMPGVTLDSVSLVPYLADPLAPSERDFIYSEVFTPNFDVPHCQQDMGSGGPGGVTLDVCGDHLFVGNSANVTIAGLPPGSQPWLAVSRTHNPTPFKGGVLGPLPVEALLGPLTADGSGQVSFPLAGGNPTGADVDLYMQALVPDPRSIPPIVLSNTVRVTWPSESSRVRNVAIRDGRYKLIRIYYDDPKSAVTYGAGVRWMLFDLRNDPHETNDLLAGSPLPPNQQGAYDDLKTKLEQLLDD